MAVIYIDGKKVEVDGADNLLQSCLSLGIDIPYFCYHPELGSVGSCRQCAVKQYNSEEDYQAGRGRLVMSCMVAPEYDAKAGKYKDMYISVDDAEAKAFRQSIVEYLMTNHPHDCPTCEEGGQCHLQDMTYMSGHNRRRYRFSKRTHHNQDLGAFINHEMNRCIACYRCVRFYKDYAGGQDLGVYASNNRVYFGRDEDGQLQSEFSGNLTEVCPTGVFTDKTHSDRYNRKWDMQYAPSICQGCSAGCNVSAGERYGEIRRIENRYHSEVNRYFLCDRGRFGYGYVNRADRPLQALKRVHGQWIKTQLDYALDETIAQVRGKKILGIGSPRASLETNFALKKWVGSENFSTGLNHHQQNLVEKAIEILTTEGIVNPSITEIEAHDAVLILGEDLTQTSSRVALAVRQAAKNKAKQMAQALCTPTWLAEPVKRIGQNALSPIYTLSVAQTKLDDISKLSAVASVEDMVKLGFLLAKILADLPNDLTQIQQILQAKQDDPHTSEQAQLAAYIAYDLIMADRPLVISGTSLGSTALMEAAAQIAQNLTQKRQAICQADSNLQDQTHYGDQASLYLTVAQANAMGVCLLGGKSLEEVLADDFEAVVVVENDLTEAMNLNRLTQVFDKKSVIVLDHQSFDWHDLADLVLPAASFAEGDGTMISAEGRVQRSFQVFDRQYYQPETYVKEGWRWLHALQCELNHLPIDWMQLDDVIGDLVEQYPYLRAVAETAPDAKYRIMGLKVAREPRRYSGRTAMRAPISIHEPMQPKDLDTGLTFSMEGYVGDKTDSALIPFAWAAGWNSPQAWNKYQKKVGGALKQGEAGIRLFDRLNRLPKRTYVMPDFGKSPTTQMDKDGKGMACLVPIYNLFASNPMVARSPVVASQLIEAVWTIAEDDAKAWGIHASDWIEMVVEGETMALPVKLVPYLAEGYIGYPVGQVPIVHANLPVRMNILRPNEVLFYQEQRQKRQEAERQKLQQAHTLMQMNLAQMDYPAQDEAVNKPAHSTQKA